MKVQKILKTNHVLHYERDDLTLCGLALKMYPSTQINGKVNCKECIERIFYCVELNKQMIKENK